MTQLLKTEAIVLRKLNYGDTSKIATLYTEEMGKLPIIVKGGRTSKSKMGFIVDPLNIIQVVLHNKESREIQLLTQADLVLSPAFIKEDLERIKYASAISELIFSLIPEREPNHKIYKGLKKILGLLNEDGENPKIIFVRFFLFLIKEIGYEIEFTSCSDCGKDMQEEKEAFYSLQKGILCPGCKENHVIFFEFSQELLQNLICLTSKKKGTFADMKMLDTMIFFLEKYVSFHIEEFKGIKSLHIFN
jgi:DNA repair protein RecO (recombination protein O)